MTISDTSYDNGTARGDSNAGLTEQVRQVANDLKQTASTVAEPSARVVSIPPEISSVTVWPATYSTGKEKCVRAFMVTVSVFTVAH